MKKLFRKLPPLQWAAFLAAFVAAILQTLAMLFDYEAESNYFARGSILPIIAFLFALLSLALGAASAILAIKRTDPPVDPPINRSKLYVFPAIGFCFALFGLVWDLIRLGGSLWMHLNDGASFLNAFITPEIALALLCPLLLFCSFFYCLNRVFFKQENTTATVFLGFAAMASCAILSVHLYFDFSVELNAPVRSLLQGGLLSAMVFFTAELRPLLKKRASRLLWIISDLVIAFAALTAIAVPVAFLTKKIAYQRIDHLCYTLFLLCMTPVALKHIITIFHTVNQAKINDPDAERTETT